MVMMRSEKVLYKFSSVILVMVVAVVFLSRLPVTTRKNTYFVSNPGIVQIHLLVLA